MNPCIREVIRKINGGSEIYFGKDNSSVAAKYKNPT